MNKFVQVVTRFFLVAILLAAYTIIIVPETRADDCELDCKSIDNDDERAVCVDRKVVCYENKIKDNKNEQNTLSGELAYIDNRIAYQEAQIEKTRLEIVRAGKEADILEARINNLSESMEKLAALLSELVVASYKAEHVSNLEMYLQNSTFKMALGSKEAQELASLQTSKLLFRSMQDKLDYDAQKQEREKLQEELEKKTQQLKAQQQNLEAQKESKAILLAQTKNDEKRYQSLLEEAKKEIDSYKRFASSAGGSTCLSESPGGGSNGWYYSQRDPRWCKQYIGGSNMTVGEVGCYIASVTMVHKRYGSSMTPSIFAANRNYFFASTAMMTNPPAPDGYTYKRLNYFDKGVIDDDLRAERPVIVHVKTNNGYGGHFIVLFAGENGSYRMHDPWYGADLEFGSRYSTGLIDSMRLFTK